MRVVGPAVLFGLFASLIGCGKDEAPRKLPSSGGPPIIVIPYDEQGQGEMFAIPPEALRAPGLVPPNGLGEGTHSFFNLHRDPNTGRLWMSPEESTQKIMNHLAGHRMGFEQAVQMVRSVDRLAEGFNQALDSKKQVEVTLKDMGSSDELLKPSKRDFVFDVNETLDIGMPDGSVYPLSIITGDFMSAHGHFTSLSGQKGMSVDTTKMQQRNMLDPTSGNILPVVYFPFTEPRGPLGPGGDNGIIIPISNLPAAIILDNQIIFIGIDESNVTEQPFDPKAKFERTWPEQFQPPQKNRPLAQPNGMVI